MRVRILIAVLGTWLTVAVVPAGAILRPRVLAGSPTGTAQWPFVAALVQHSRNAFDGQFCGGSVIAPTVILTAAHCVSGASAGSIDVITGRAQLSAAQIGQRVGVRSISVDPSYNAGTEHHDAAVLRLASPTRAPAVSMAGSADAALLTPGSPFSVAGWGLLDNSGDAPDILHAATIQALRIGRCQDAYGSDVTSTLMICAGTPVTGAPDACQGDSGGPLVSGAGSTARLVGLVAFGGDQCGDPSAPGVYTRVSVELPWIARVIGLTPTEPSKAPTVRTRISRISCGAVICTVQVGVTGDVGAVGRIVIRVSRSGAATVERASTAVRTGPRAWRARIDLPIGSLHIAALAYTKAGVAFGHPGSEDISVSAG